MKFEWDERKNKINLSKHSISFEEAIEIFESIRIVGVDKRKNYGEKRNISIGTIENMVLVVVHTKRKQKIRIVSARKANRKERRLYYEHIKKAN